MEKNKRKNRIDGYQPDKNNLNLPPKGGSGVLINRDRLISIGNEKAVTITFVNKKTNNIVEKHEIYKVIRRKNKLIGFGSSSKIWLKFDTIDNAKKAKIQIRNYLV